MTSPALSPLARALARTDFAESHWCDAQRDVEVAAGQVMTGLAVLVDGERQRDPDPPCSRPIIGSRGRLEVLSRGWAS
ncbi:MULTISPECIES: hypothetical protein [Amycolatopsis]|uniref:hypothetical protein n=1 Tax=Amycolatopsis TaxID=1813 RepID=UPI001C59658C|nr:hypothetical protein [Amycolatopsis sp. TNS106]QXV61747.1 hypothetical protein CVV72_35315 [Amycolatopsis sp. TNS106]